MKVAQFLGIDPDGSRVVKFKQLLQCAEVDVVGRVDGLGCAKYTMCDWDSAS